MADLVLERVTDAGGAARWHQVHAAAVAHDHVGLPADPVEELLPLLEGTTSGSSWELWLGTAGGTPVATAGLRLPELENTDAAMVNLQVHPGHRRSGHGRALLAAVVPWAAEHGRSRLLAEVAVPLPPAPGTGNGQEPTSPGAGFARAAGGRPVTTEVRRLLDLRSLERDTLADLRAGAAGAARGYTVLQWVDQAPEELLVDLAELTQLMSTDPPMDDLVLEPEAWTPQRYREKEQSTKDRGRNRYVTAVRHDASGRLVGYTDIGVNARQDEVAYQWDTIVREDHRGHRLGMLLKAANLDLLRERQPQTRYVNTWNAGVNEHMIAINEQLGFVPVDGWQEWQLDL